MAKISEMTLEELQDYALSQENVIESQKKELEDTRAVNVELQDLNKALQKRNNDLFSQVEQQFKGSSSEGSEAPTVAEIESCEDFAKNLKL